MRLFMKNHLVACPSIPVILTALLLSVGEPTVIQDGIPVNNLSEYTVRYLSEDGNDTDNCLSDQGYPPLSNATIEYCRSLIYTLTGDYKNESSNVSDLVIIILPGRYLIGEQGIKIIDYRNIFLTKMPGAIGEVVFRCFRFLEESFNNLFVVFGVNISLNNIVFTECGSYGSPVRFQHTLNITVSNCTFRNNSNCGLTADRSEQIVIVNSVFQDNNSTAFYMPTDALVDPKAIRFGGGLLISWRSTDNAEAANTVVVKNCTFINNHADINARNKNDTRPKFYRPRGHGGAIVVTFRNVTGFTVTIMDTRMVENTAVSSGGGMFISFSEGSTNNKVLVKNTTFEENTCSQDGGAISVNTFQVANGNTLTVEDSMFNGNEATVRGGACSLNLQDALVPEGAKSITNVAAFTNVKFTNNTSTAGGSAVHLVSSSLINQIVATTNFTDCTFFGNKEEKLQQSAIVSFRFPISLNGTNVFRSNEGGGISLMQSRVDVDGTVHFIENSAVVGGGMALEDQCLIHLLRDAAMYFIRNSAQMEGGGIYVRAPSVAIDFNIDPIFNTGCFIQYEVNTEPFSLDPSDWKANITFINNTAGTDGAAIYAASIDRCKYVPKYNETTIFNITPPFIFSNNRVLNPLRERVDESLATAPSILHAELIEPKITVGAPGEVFVFNVNAYDQTGNQQAAIWNINAVDEEREREEFLSLPIGGGSKTYSIEGVGEDFVDNCSSGQGRSLEFSLVQVLTGGVNDVSNMNISISCCHPGYTFNSKTSLCEIGDANGVIVRAHPRGRYFYAQSELYVESRNGTLTSAVIPPTFQNCMRDGSRPGCLVKFDFPSEQCANGRKGFLCGHCPEGKWVDFTLRQCKECTKQDAVFVAGFFVVFFAVSLLILFFNIRIPNELKGFLFFIQVVGFVYERSTVIDWDWHLSRLFGFSLHLFLCPYPGYDALVTAGYGFIIPLLSTLAIVIYIISARFSKVLSNRSSFEGIWFLSIITFKYTSDTCFNILRCQKVSGEGITREFVYFYNGSITCFQSTHLGVSIFALIGLILVILFPVLILIISFRTYKFTQPFTDVLTKGIKVSCRWWSGFDLFRRLLFTIVVLFFNYVQPDGTQIALFFTGLAIYIIIALFKPYTSRVANVIEAVILTDLLLLTAFFLNTDEQAKAFIHPLSQLLLLLPYMSVTLYITFKMAILLWKKKAPESYNIFRIKISDRLDRIRVFISSSHESNTKKEQSLEIKIENEVVHVIKFSRANYSAFREELLDSKCH